MALANTSGGSYDKNTVKNDNGTVLNAGNTGDSRLGNDLNVSDNSNSQGQSLKPVEKDGTGGSTTDSAGVAKASSSQPFAKNSSPSEWKMFGGNVASELQYRDYSGSVNDGATEVARGQVETRVYGSGELSEFNILSRPDTQISTGRTKSANAGQSAKFVAPKTGADLTSSDFRPSRSNPGKINWNLGGIPQSVNYASKERGEFELSAPAPAPAPDPNAPPTWTSNYDTSEFEIAWAANIPNNWVSLGLESIGYSYGGSPLPTAYNRETQDDFEIQIDWGDGTTATSSASNIAAQNHQYADQSSRTITVTSTGNAWPDWHQVVRQGTNGGFIGSNYQYQRFHEPPGTLDPYVGVSLINSITSWGGLFTGFAGIIGGTSAYDSWAYSNDIPRNDALGGLGELRQIKFNTNIPDTGFEMPDHVPNTTSLKNFFAHLWQYNNHFVDSQGNPMQIPAVETENFGNSVYQITDLRFTFEECRYHVPDISRWRTDNVTSMEGLFFNTFYAPARDLSSWNTSNVTNMRQTFQGYKNFNSDIGNWDTSNVTDMHRMFYNATSFNQDISSWDFSSVTVLTQFLQIANSFSQANYDALLIRWAEQADGVILRNMTTTVSSNYTLGGAAAAARAELVNTYGWTITDNGGV
jgi:surface protein